MPGFAYRLLSVLPKREGDAVSLGGRKFPISLYLSPGYVIEPHDFF